MMKIVVLVQIVCGRRQTGGSSVRRTRLSGGWTALMCGGRRLSGGRTVIQITSLSGHNGN